MRELAHPLAHDASDAMTAVWSDDYRFRKERELWFQVLAYHAMAGALPVNESELNQVLGAYRFATNAPIDQDRIRRRERITKHDLMARLQEYNHLASMNYHPDTELAHLGMTSADVVDNVALLQMMTSLVLLRIYTDQGTAAWETLTKAMASLPFRGIKGPVGTQQDQIDLLGSQEEADRLDDHLRRYFGFESVMNSVGQVYPRSIDTQVASAVMVACFSQLGLHELPPPPMVIVTRGYYRMITEYSDSQWNEGDVSTSAVRRVCLPGLFLSADIIMRSMVNREEEKDG